MKRTIKEESITLRARDISRATASLAVPIHKSPSLVSGAMRERGSVSHRREWRRKVEEKGKWTRQNSDYDEVTNGRMRYSGGILEYAILTLVLRVNGESSRPESFFISSQLIRAFSMSRSRFESRPKDDPGFTISAPLSYASAVANERNVGFWELEDFR